MGTLNVAAEVDGVTVRGDGEMLMTLSSGRLPSLNRQLQFVTYTNTLFHPSTADTGERAWTTPGRFLVLRRRLTSFSVSAFQCSFARRATALCSASGSVTA